MGISGTPRAIGVRGTVARATVGAFLLGSVLYGRAARGWHPVACLVGLLVLPALITTAQWWRARRHPTPLRATGPLGHAVNLAVFLALYLIWWYSPAVDVLSDAAMLFYGSSMLLAAARRYAGCEALAVSNWLLRRDDRVGCALFGAIDVGEARRSSAGLLALASVVDIELLLGPAVPERHGGQVGPDGMPAPPGLGHAGARTSGRLPLADHPGKRRRRHDRAAGCAVGAGVPA
jgi:hypothetical protein